MRILSRQARMLMAGLAAATFAGSALADNLKIGAMREGTSWYVFAATLEQLLEPALEGTDVEVVARGGGVANPMVVQNGDAEVALSNVATAVWAREGHELFDGASAPDIRALVGGLNSVYVGAMAREDFLDKVGTTDLEEILNSGQPIRVVMKPTGSSAPPTADMIMEALGSGREEIKEAGGEIIQVATPQIPSVIRDGNADLYFDTIIKGHPTITEVSLTGDVRFLDVPEKARKVLAENGLNPEQYGPWFEGQDGPNWGADLGTVLIAHADVSDEVAYEITKTLVENAEKMGEAHAAWQNFNPEEAWKPEKTGIPLHSGAEKYYKERGWL